MQSSKVSGRAANAGTSTGTGGKLKPLRKQGSLSRGAMLADVFLVAVWGATIPGLMWLGAAGGF